MLIIPAVDIRDGKCVRLFRGEFNRETIYSDDPVAMAKRWSSEGAEYIHVVDLDGARDGSPRNEPIIEELIRAVNCPVEVGGGIRTTGDAKKYLNMGAARIVIGSAVADHLDRVAELCEHFPDRIAVGLDIKGDRIMVSGWMRETTLTLDHALEKLEKIRPRAIIYTEIVRDGTLAGPPLDGLIHLTSVTRIPVIASGGVRNLEDIQKLVPLAARGVEGVIVGKSIYSGTLDLKAAILASRGKR